MDIFSSPFSSGKATKFFFASSTFGSDLANFSSRLFLTLLNDSSINPPTHLPIIGQNIAKPANAAPPNNISLNLFLNPSISVSKNDFSSESFDTAVPF